MSEQLSIVCGTRGRDNKRAVIAALNGKQFRDTFEVDSAYHRGKFREAVIAKFGLPEDAHEWLEERVIAAADAADDSSEADIPQPKLSTLSMVEAMTAEWLWQDRFPTGSIVVIDGDPGLGKSQLTLDLAARISRGDCLPPGSAPDGTYSPADVLLLSAEDDPARTIRPRLDAAGADVSRIHLLQATNDIDGSERPVSLPADVPMIERIVEQRGVALAVVDPLSAYIGADIEMNSDADVRKCLSRIAASAERTGCVWLLLRHLNKKAGGAALYRGGGSIAISGAARAAFIVGQSEDDPDVRIMAPTKCNLGPTPKSLAFTVESCGATSRVVWQGESDTTANELVGTNGAKGSCGKKEEAVSLILARLMSGPQEETSVFEECERRGIGRSTYWAARRELGVRSEKSSFGGAWILSLPDHHDESASIPF